MFVRPGRIAQSVGHLTRKSGVLGSRGCLGGAMVLGKLSVPGRVTI